MSQMQHTVVAKGRSLDHQLLHLSGALPFHPGLLCTVDENCMADISGYINPTPPPFQTPTPCNPPPPRETVISMFF